MIDFSQYRPLSFTSCENPTLTLFHGKKQLCKCGKCPHCRQSYRNKTSVYLANEMDNWKYKIFFTLTYDRYHVPTMRWFADDFGRVQFQPVGRCAEMFSYIPYNPLTSFRYPFHENNKFEVYDHYQDFVVPPLSGSSDSHEFGVLCYRDMQLFKKRFIKNLFNYVKKLYPERFRECSKRYSIFYVGEYGTRKYRPHFHVLFMFDDEVLCPDLNQFRNVVYDSWAIRRRTSGYHNKYSIEHFADFRRFTTEFETDKNPNFSFVQSVSQVSSYVSSYVTSYTSLPFILTLRPWNSRTISPHGKYGSFGTSKTDRTEILSKIKCAAYGFTNELPLGDYFSKVVYSSEPSSGKITTSSVPYPQSALRSLFCKPCGYFQNDSSCFKRLLRFFSDEVFKVFQHLSRETFPRWQSELDFVNDRFFKSIMKPILSPIWSIVSKRCIEDSRRFFHIVYADDRFYYDFGASSESTWLFLKNGLRTMLEYNLSLDEYWYLFTFTYDFLLPQCDLYKFYSEQQHFANNGIRLSSFIDFYDELPRYTYTSSLWYSTLGIEYLCYSEDEITERYFWLYLKSLRAPWFDSIHLRYQNILFNHFKHKNRSDF